MTPQMKLLYVGESGCDIATLKRLNLIADEINFMDYPAVKFGNWGMVGHDSFFRRVVSGASDPVRIAVHPAPGGPPGELLNRYLEPDVTNPEFRATFLDGLNDDRFARKFIALDGDFVVRGTTLKGRDIVRALAEDRSLRDGPLEPQWDMADHDAAFDAREQRARRDILARELMTASVHVTAAMVVAEGIGAIPVSDEAYFGRLLALRLGSPRYVQTTSSITPYLGLEIMRAVIPDGALERLSVKDTLDYRAATKDAYEAWLVELNALAARLDELRPDQVADAVPRILATEIAPRVLAYRNELRSARDRLFAGVLKDLLDWKLPTLSLAAVTLLNLPSALALFAAGLRTLPHVVDHYTSRREVGRKHAISYVVGVTKDLGTAWDTDSGLLRSEA